MSDTVPSAHLSPVPIVHRETTAIPTTENTLVDLTVSQVVYSDPLIGEFIELFIYPDMLGFIWESY